MSRKSTIRWGESDAEKISREIQKFNAKIYRVKSKNPDVIGILPQTIKKEDKKKLIEELKTKSRSEFKKEINSLARFTRKGAEKIITSKTGNKVTAWEKREVGLKVAQINRERTRERKIVENMDATSRGEKIGLNRGEMGSERMNELKPKKYNFDKIKGGKEWEKFKASVDKQASPESRNERMEAYKTNYITSLKNAYGEYAKDIIDLVEGLPAEKVVETYYTEQEATPIFQYDKLEMDFKLDILERIWQGVNTTYNDEIYD